jgi:uncharacterized membrane protein
MCVEPHSGWGGLVGLLARLPLIGTGVRPRAGHGHWQQERTVQKTGGDREPAPVVPRYTWSDTVGALLLACASFTPSLLPRNWLLQGVIAGVTAAIGYGLGGLVAWLIGAVHQWRPPPAARRRMRRAFAVVAVVCGVAALWQGQRWQQQIHGLMGLPAPAHYESGGILLVAGLVFVAAVAAARLLRRATQWTVRLFDRVVPDRLARPLAVVAVTGLVLVLVNGVLFRGFTDVANAAFSLRDSTTSDGTPHPAAAERSGSPASLVRWDGLGREGRDFIGHGPTVAQLSAFSGRQAAEPIRIYAGLRSEASTRRRAALAVHDLRRAGGFDREVLVVVTTTGTGWVDEVASDSLEYMFNGDTAIVALQYSFLPSWISFLVDQSKAQDAGRELFNQVYDAWAKLPIGDRPRLYTFGESLGAFGGEAAFSGLADIRNRTDGVLWVGPPNFNALWRGFVDDRAACSPEWLPIHDSGRTVRFAADGSDLDRPDGPWGHPRVVYLQHASDPVVWWSPRLVLVEPDWLADKAGRDVSEDMVWIPFVTFWQVTADLPFATHVPAGHGHKYRAEYVDAWARVTQPDGWTQADTERLRNVLP